LRTISYCGETKAQSDKRELSTVSENLRRKAKCQGLFKEEVGDENLQNADNLADPEIIGAEIMTRLETAFSNMKELINFLDEE
jgi:hypothetical protein